MDPRLIPVQQSNYHAVSVPACDSAEGSFVQNGISTKAKTVAVFVIGCLAMGLFIASQHQKGTVALQMVGTAIGRGVTAPASTHADNRMKRSPIPVGFRQPDKLDSVPENTQGMDRVAVHTQRVQGIERAAQAASSFSSKLEDVPGAENQNGLPTIFGLVFAGVLAGAGLLWRQLRHSSTPAERMAMQVVEKKEEMDGIEEDEMDRIGQILKKPYQFGFASDIESEKIPKGLTEDTIRLLSSKKNEPDWMLKFRLKAFKKWKTMKEPDWSENEYPNIDYQDLVYYSEPKFKKELKSLDEVDPELLKTFDKLGIPLQEQKKLANVKPVAIDAVFDSVSIATTYKEELMKHGVIFCSISEAIQKYPDLVKKYMGSVVPVNDNFFSALNSAVFTDGSFTYIPKGVECPMELSTYFRINDQETGQFERTLIIAEDDSCVSYLEGCTAPAYDTNQLHAAVVELWAGKNASIKYSTVQNWYAGDEEGKGGIYNFVTKRGKCDGDNSKISWTQVETGSAVTWKYPSCILKGKNSYGEFYSVALTNNMQQADTGTKMIHIGEGSRSKIVSKGISAGKSKNVYRGLVQVNPSAKNARNFTQCDSLLIADQANASTYPYIQVREPSARIEHEASTSKISDEQLFYLQQRGIKPEEAVGMIIGGFCKEVFNQLPMEFASEVDALMSLKLENSVG